MNNNFEDDLEDGQMGERAVRHFVETQWNKKFITYGDTSAFDIMFQNNRQNPVFFEVKTDMFEKDWNKGGTGNMAIEYKCRGKPSGIRTTLAGWFAYYFPNIRKNHLWIIRMDKLKKLIKDNKFSTVDAGEPDEKTGKKVSRCYLIPRFDFRGYFSVFTFDGNRWLPSLD